MRVHTQRGWMVLASDAAHYAENYRRRSPLPVYHVGDMLRGFDKLRSLADSDAHVIPGHDPMVMRSYPAWPAGQAEIVAVHATPGTEGSSPSV